jgi:pimeloyl-ACP methyl ester carboxylesterase
MLLQRYSAALGLAAIMAATSALPLAANDTSQFPFARLGPPDAPVKLYTVERGEGPPVLLIHGFGTNSFTWRHVAPDLARDHKVIAVDLKGFGRSDKPFDERYAASDQAELLAQLILDRDLHNLTIVGHSFGGGIALLLALEADTRLHGRIAKLVLLDTIARLQGGALHHLRDVSRRSIRALAERCDLLYLHVDSDILDARFVQDPFEIETAIGNLGEVHLARICEISHRRTVLGHISSIHEQARRTSRTIHGSRQ